MCVSFPFSYHAPMMVLRSYLPPSSSWILLTSIRTFDGIDCVISANDDNNNKTHRNLTSQKQLAVPLNSTRIMPLEITLLGASTVEWTAPDPCLVFDKNSSRLYTDYEFCEEKNHRHFQYIAIY